MLNYICVRYARQKVEMLKLMSDNAINKFKSTLQGNSGCVQIAMGCLKLIGLIFSVTVMGLLIILISGTLSLSNLLASIGDFFNATPTATVVPGRTLVSSLQPLGQLVSISVEVAQADINVLVSTGGLNLCSHNANHVAQGVVEAGVDITQVEEDNISYDEATDRYTVTLPSPQITSCRIEYIRQYERQGGNPTCGIDWDNVRLLAQYEATTLFAQDTLEAGILSRAERETTLLMDSFINALTGSDVEIVYASTTEVNLPPSCQPQIPRGWSLDEETQLWIQGE